MRTFRMEMVAGNLQDSGCGEELSREYRDLSHAQQVAAQLGDS